MKTAISFQAANNNPGDSITTKCAQGILLKTFKGNLSFDTWYLSEDTALPYKDLKFHNYNYGIVFCTPWIWDQAHSSRKYKLLTDFHEKIKTERKIAIGVGASFPLSYINDEKYWGEKTIFQLKPFWDQYDSVICRDSLAYDLFSKILTPEKVHLLPCPAFYSATIFEQKPNQINDELLVFCECDPKYQIGLCQTESNAAMIYQDKMVKQGIDVLVMFDRDYEKFVNRYKTEPKFYITDPAQIVKIISTYKKVTSARVHACLPALSLGIKTDIISLDSRALTAIQLGATPIITNIKSIEKYSTEIPKYSFNDIVQQIRTIIK